MSKALNLNDQFASLLCVLPSNQTCFLFVYISGKDVYLVRFVKIFKRQDTVVHGNLEEVISIHFLKFRSSFRHNGHGEERKENGQLVLCLFKLCYYLLL